MELHLAVGVFAQLPAGIDKTLDSGGIDARNRRKVQDYGMQNRPLVAFDLFARVPASRTNVVPGSVAERRECIWLAALGDAFNLVDEHVDLC